jgi:phospholipase C
MATQRSATINITNDTGGNAWILLFHNNSSNGTQSDAWNAAPGQTVGPLTVYFETGIGTGAILDYWSVLVHVKDGPAAGFYVNSGAALDPYWKECQLQHQHADKTLTFTVSTTSLDIALPPGGCKNGMTKLAPRSPITHVFVVMLENHSFDNIFAMSGIRGITAATAANSNSYGDETYHVQSSAPLSMTTDPGHEFPDVVEQLAGEGASYPKGGPYPKIDNSGFVANYATSTTEGGQPSPDHRGDIMASFATPAQLPTIFQLATEFALCDHWHASLPGPTWPNRFFVHGASSAGLDTSPSTWQMGEWELPGGGFHYPHGSIYQSLDKAGIPYRLYNDSDGTVNEQSIYSDDPLNGSSIGAVPQVTALQGITLGSINSLQHFAADLHGPYPFPYTFIEPHYGDVVSGTYAGGSSQHPMDDVYGGQNLLAAVYAAIRNSPYWNTSLLIVTYDEHGGFYDSVPPASAVAPADHPSNNYNTYGFDFSLYGVRVPAMVVSPLIPAGTVDHTLYDHASVLKTVEQLFGLAALTERDANANHLLHLLSLNQARTDCPVSLRPPKPLLRASRLPLTAEEQVRIDLQPVPERGNLIGALRNLMKAEIELSGGTPPEIAAIKARFDAIRTRGDARVYAAAVMEKVRVVKEQRRIAAKRLGRGGRE